MKPVGIQSIGHYVPAKVLSNDDLSKLVDTNDEWIMSRTGIHERRIAEGETTADMATKAARDCLGEQSGSDIDLLLASCGSADRIYPTQSAQIAHALPLANSTVIDINIACSGMIGGIILAQGMLQSGLSKRAMVTASEKMTSYMDYTDRSNCILFGDGASAVTLSTENYEHEIIATEMGSDPAGANYLTMGERGVPGYFWQDGKNIYRFVQTKLVQLIEALKVKAKLGDEPFWFVPHQANARMFESIAPKANVPWDRFILNLDKYGNTSSASIGIALNEAAQAGKFKKGDAIMMTGFGAGLAWAGAVIRW